MVKEKTFAHQNSLPSLPVPPLQQTLQKYLDSVEPLVTPEQFAKTRQLVTDFENGIGQKLHNALLEKSRKERNWLERWWEDYVYLIPRYPIFPLINFGGAGPRYDYWPPKIGTQSERSALITYWVLRYWEALRNEELEVQRSRNIVFDMHQSYRLFNTCRIPGETKDTIRHFFKTTSEGGAPSHIVVMYQGHFWKLDICDKNGCLYTPPQLQRAFEKILHIGLTTNGSYIGALTCSDRTDWWKNREYLLSLSPKNRDYFDVIEKSILIVSFSDETPSTDTDTFLSRYAIAGDPRCQYADKSFTWHFFKNGLTCTSGEHGNMDAITMILLNSYVDDHVVEQGFKWKGGDSLDQQPDPVPSEINFVIDSKIKKAVNSSMEVQRPIADDVEALAWHFLGFGTNFFKQHKVYGDTIVQLALQCAYYKLHNKPAPTYETATTRKYFHGRTETVRSCTKESLALAKIIADPKATHKQKVDRLWEAIKKHDKLMTEAMDGHGCDRHLFGLRTMAAENNIPDPEIFLDPSWKQSGGDGNFILSTSFVGYTVVFGGVAAMCTNGYGTFYKMVPNSVTFFMSKYKSSKQTNLALWREHVNSALVTLGVLLSSPKL